jgi:hypothetical protein
MVVAIHNRISPSSSGNNQEESSSRKVNLWKLANKIK